MKNNAEVVVSKHLDGIYLNLEKKLIKATSLGPDKGDLGSVKYEVFGYYDELTQFHVSDLQGFSPKEIPTSRSSPR